jgi:CRP/FNR family transcriptional regulator, cyclic AMP receptor protein
MNGIIRDKLIRFFSESKVLEFKRGETILRSDDEPQGVFYLEQGFIKMNTIFIDGRELTLNIYKPGTYFPMTWAIAGIPNAYYFQAMTPVILRRKPKNEFMQFINGNPDILMELTNRILIGLDGILTNVQHLLSGDSYHRVVSAIILSARRFGDTTGSGKIILKIPLTHQDIADIAGITRETASIAIGKLIREGIITHHYRKMTINSFKNLENESPISETVAEGNPVH